MDRALTDVEVFFIQNSGQTVEMMAQTIGVSEATVQAKLEGPAPAAQQTQQSATSPKTHQSIFKGKTEEEVKAMIHNPDEHKVFNNFARADGVTVMTQAASELADARKVLKVNQPNVKKDQADKIHVIHQNRPTR